MAQNNQPTLGLNIPEVMHELRLGRNKVLELIHSGKLRSVRAGKRIIVPRKELEAYLEREVA